MPAEHELIRGIGKGPAAKARTAVDGAKILRALRSGDGRAAGYGDVEAVSHVHEMAIADYWRFASAGSGQDREKRNALEEMCGRCFDMMEVLPLPDDPVSMMVHVLKLVAYAYIGERVDGMRRYMKEHRSILDVGVPEDAPWDRRMFGQTCLSLMHLVRKESAADLRKSLEIISGLRAQQREREAPYLEESGGLERESRMLLAAMYHMAKAVEIAATYMSEGRPADPRTDLTHHFERAVGYSRSARVMELDIVLRITGVALRKMVDNSVWAASRMGMGRFAKALAESDRPVLELLYPQREALRKGLLDPAHRAVVVSLPTSSGKTMIAELKILQALNADPDGKVAYVVPTRALVNQIANRLRRDLGHLGIKVEKMSGAEGIDGFEDAAVSDRAVRVIVATPEKLDRLIRQPGMALAESMALAVIDEGHNLADGERGVHLEMLLSTIKGDCPRAGVVIMTPFAPNASDISEWLDPENPGSISIGLNWRPNDRAVGLVYAEGGGRDITTVFQPLATSQNTVKMGGPVALGRTERSPVTFGKAKTTKWPLAAMAAAHMDREHSLLVVGRAIPDTWKIAKAIYEMSEDPGRVDSGVDLVRRFVRSELGAEFPLGTYLERGIGVHHAGLPDDVREMVEWLMESGRIRVLVSTTTTAQGINFPVSGVLLSSFMHGRTRMSVNEFWNLVGRAGRIDQPSVGIVGLSAQTEEDKLKAAKYVRRQIGDLTSALTSIAEKAASAAGGFDVQRLAGDPDWSSFLQYIAHTRSQYESMDRFVAESERVLMRTYGYRRMRQETRAKLLDAVRDYAKGLDGRPDLPELSDLTGFSPDTVSRARDAMKDLRVEPGDLGSRGLFSKSTGRLSGLMSVMLESMPEVRARMEDDLPGHTITKDLLGGIAADWVSGARIPDIAEAHFGGSGRDEITSCVTAIYRKITGPVAWGLAGMQKIAGLETGGRGGGQRGAASVPAMVYYGVGSEEAILMRRHGVPRMAAEGIGKMYAEEGNLYSKRADDVLPWLDGLPDGKWAPRAGAPGGISGGDYKAVWRRLAGLAR